MSRLAEAIAAEPLVQKRGPLCGVAVLRSKLDHEDRAMFEQLLKDVKNRERTAASVARILTRAGYRFHGDQINRHLRNECQCTPRPRPSLADPMRRS